MKKKTDKEPKSITFMVTNLVTITGCSIKKAKEIAEKSCCPNSNFEVILNSSKGGLYSVASVNSKTETVIKVDKKA